MADKLFMGIVSLICVFSLRGNPDASAGTLVTVFSVKTSVGGTVFDQKIPTSPGMRFILPSLLSDWNCTATPRFVSNDGKSVYVNVVCDETTSPLVVGMSITCPLNKEGTDTDSFFMRSASTEVDFMGECATFLQQAPAPARGTHL